MLKIDLLVLIVDRYKILLISDLYKIEGAIVFVDFSKAFDSLEWNFMFSILKHFGFNESFIRWVKTLYNDIQTCVMNNGWISEVFKNTRVIRQGCPFNSVIICFICGNYGFKIKEQY